MKLNSISLLALTASALCGSLLSYLLFDGNTPLTAGTVATGTHAAKAANTCTFDLVRVPGYTHTQPILSSGPMCESPRLAGLRGSIASIVEGMKADGVLSSASVHVRDFHRGEWTSFNGDEHYDPGSMLKLPLLISYLMMAEEDPAILNRTWTCEAGDFNIPQFSAFPSAQIMRNMSYTVAQLLEYSIVHSDNRATVMLLRHLGPARYIKTFTTLGLPAPEWNDKAYRMNAKSCSVFMSALYNSALLSPMSSDRALEMLIRASFKRGLVANLPSDVEVAHKFGEAGSPEMRQLHETGLVYAGNTPYLITVMTSGADVDKLAGAIATISRTVYDRMGAL